MRKIFLGLFVLGFVSTAMSFAQIETVVFPFTAQAVDPSVVAGNGLLSSNGAFAGSVNPADVPFAESKINFGAGAQMVESLSNLGAAFSYNINGKLGISANYLGALGKKYELISSGGVFDGEHTPMDMMLGLSVAYRPLSFLSIGLGAKYISSNLAPDYKLNSFAVDAVAMYKAKGFSAAAGAKSLGGKVNGFSLPASAILGAAYELEFGDSSAVKAALEGDYYFYGGFRAALSAVYAWDDTFFVRAGYCFSSKALTNSYAGAGIGLKFGGFGLDASCRYDLVLKAPQILLGLRLEL